MATVTWDGSTDTDYGTAANWDTGSVPTSSDDVIIANVSNDCVLDGTRSVNSFVVQAGGDFNGNTEMLTVVGENGAGFAVDIDGDIIGTTTNITITTAATTAIDFNATAGNVRHLTVNHASCVINSENSCELSGNLTITAGNFNANGNALTVTGDVSVTGTLTGANSAISMGSLTIASGGTYSATSGTTTITSETSGTGRTLSNAGTFTHNKGLVKVDLASPTTTQTQNGPFWDLEQVDASTDFLAEAALTIYNNFTFVGDFDYTNNSHHMVVHGNMKIGDGSTTTRYCAQSAYTNNLTVHGTLEITNGATADLGTHGTVNLGGIRNTGGSIS